MFIVCFGDGLGNQMFQYAFYRAMQEHYTQVDIKMDIFHIYGPMIHNGFELDKIFGIKRNECHPTEALKYAENYPTYMKKNAIPNMIQSLRQRFIGCKASAFYQTDPTSYHEVVFELNTLSPYLFRGNWLNVDFFHNIQEKVIEEFTFIQPLDNKNQQIVGEMKNCNSVAVHIRRGDYIQSTLIDLTVEYYKKGMAIIESKITEPVYYIFSDDKEYIRKNYNFFGNYKIVEGNTGSDSYIDMQLMSCCKHNIIANSTFSFWGAYLNCNHNKIVIAPSKVARVFRNPIACHNWVIVDVDTYEETEFNNSNNIKK